MSFNNIIEEVSKYYTEKVKEHGATPRGVDWNSEESQQLRFNQLLKITDKDTSNFSILDYGCGFGSLYGYLKSKQPALNYTGFDISDEMLNKAKDLYKQDQNAKWINTINDLDKYDYVVASGIFNVRMETGDKEWTEYILDTLKKIDKMAVKGFSFNILTSYSDKEYMRDYLFYADPAFFFDYCKRNFSKYVALLHDYPLYEFSILVNKKEGN
jgi:SAM-dependent methyltransferase